MFHLVAVASVARAVPEVLMTTDRKLSDAHRAMIGEWSQCTKPASTPLIHFLKTIRDLLLHDGTLQAYATASGTGHRDEVVIETEAYYSVARYDEQGQRHDLLAELRWALDWLKAELAEIEAKLPPRESPFSAPPRSSLRLHRATPCCSISTSLTMGRVD
jgi:hypothetical protein